MASFVYAIRHEGNEGPGHDYTYVTHVTDKAVADKYVEEKNVDRYKTDQYWTVKRWAAIPLSNEPGKLLILQDGYNVFDTASGNRERDDYENLDHEFPWFR